MEEYIITDEDSSIHWKFFDVKDRAVLDLGCGRWYTEVFEEFSPVYFERQGATRVIGIDSNEQEIEFYVNALKNNDKFVFETVNIQTTQDIIDLLNKYPEVTALKCDIEGFESTLLDLTSDQLKHIDELAIEVHSKELNDLFRNKIQEWGFTLKLYASITHNLDRLGVLFCTRGVNR